MRCVGVTLFFLYVAWDRVVLAPPPTKRPRYESDTVQPAGDAVCLVRGNEFQGARTDCGGTLDPLSDFSNQQLQDSELYGASNLAELFLLRGGIFHDQTLHQHYICKQHQNELGTNWVRKQPTVKRQGAEVTRCNMPRLPDLPALPAPQHDITAVARYKLTKDDSLALWRQLYEFVPLGTAMCQRHNKFVQDLRHAAHTSITPLNATININSSRSCNTSQRQPGHQYGLRQAVHAAQGDSPLERVSWTMLLHGNRLETCPEQNSPCTVSSGGSNYQLSSPDSQSPIRANQKTCEVQIKKGVRKIAAAIGVPQVYVKFPRKERFLALATGTQAKRVNVVSHITEAVMKVFAPDAPHELFRRIAKNYGLDTWSKNNTEKFTELIEAVVDQYRDASSRQERLQTLGLIAPMVRYLELQSYIPGLTPYSYKEARRYAKMFQAGFKEPRSTVIRERYDRAKVERFISFITSPNVVIDMPFGHVTVRHSSGIKQEIPNLIRITVNSRIILQYQSYLRDTQQETLALSESTMLRVLQACKALTRKSLLGLDYYTYEGIEGIGNLIELAETIKRIDSSSDWAKEATSMLKDLKIFFKTDYKIYIHVQSEFSDYSRAYALSDRLDKTLQVDELDQTRPLRRCAQCIAMLDLFKGFEAKIASSNIKWPTDADKREAEFILEKSQEAIQEWQKHIVRTINQNNGKDEILQNLQSQDVWILMDWAMKFIPRKGTESQTEWYGKRGISWHISVAFVRDPDTNVFSMRTYVHIFDPVAQDSETVLAIIKDVIQRVKSELPAVRKVYLRSDNAACYHSGPTLAALPKISEQTGVHIVRYDFSDPQSGKGACDRATSVIKRHVHIYVDENHRCTTPAEFFDCANSYNGVNSATFIHAGLMASKGLRKGSIGQITRFHNFEFTNNGSTRAWQAYKIGSGKIISVTERLDTLPNLEPVYAVGTAGHRHDDLLTNSDYWVQLTTKVVPPAQQQPMAPAVDDEWVSDDLDDMDNEAASGITSDSNADDPVALEGRNRLRLFPCEEEGCDKVYQMYWNWYMHVSVGKHTKRPERQSLRDFSIQKYVERIKESNILSGIPEIEHALQSQQDEESRQDSEYIQNIGWALKVRKPIKHFTAVQKEYLTAKFNEGASTGKKYDPRDVARQMRKDAQFPSKADWLTYTQIASFWSRLSRQREQSTATQYMSVPTEDDYDVEEVADDPSANAFSDHVAASIEAVIRKVMEE